MMWYEVVMLLMAARIKELQMFTSAFSAALISPHSSLLAPHQIQTSKPPHSAWHLPSKHHNNASEEINLAHFELHRAEDEGKTALE